VWIPTRGTPPNVLLASLVSVLVPAVLFSIFIATGGFPFFEAILTFSVRPAWLDPPTFSLLIWVIAVGLPINGLLLFLSGATLRIGMNSEGVRVVSRLRTFHISWPDLRPGVVVSAGAWVRPTGTPKTIWDATGFWATREQMLALLSHPLAPRDQFPDSFWKEMRLEPPSRSTL